MAKTNDPNTTSENEGNRYRKFINEFAGLIRRGRELPMGLSPLPRPEIPVDAPKALFFAPHPDDETIQGGMALRLMREAKWNVINVAVTQGRIVTRKAELGGIAKSAVGLDLACGKPRPAGLMLSP